jgi:transcriptional regulator with PAS, ATPase and Fis domain
LCLSYPPCVNVAKTYRSWLAIMQTGSVVNTIAPQRFLSGVCTDAYRSYRWPGNVRELVNTLERTIAVARNESVLFPKHLPMQIRIEVTRDSLKKDQSDWIGDNQFPLFETSTAPCQTTVMQFICRQNRNICMILMQEADYNIAKACEQYQDCQLHVCTPCSRNRGIPLQR